MSGRASMFMSPFASAIDALIAEKRTLGHKYVREEQALRALDRELLGLGCTELALSRDVVATLSASRPGDARRTASFRARIVYALASFLLRAGHPAHLPDLRALPSRGHGFRARIFTREELRSLFAAADARVARGAPPWTQVFFRLLYGCGLRLGEARTLKCGDVDLVAGVIRVRQGKFRKDRLVPVAARFVTRLEEHARVLRKNGASDPFFPSPRGGCYAQTHVYQSFRTLLRHASISHGGRGRGPRVHDLRHTFAVHRLEQWYRDGVDLSSKLAVLSTYLGHQRLIGTQVYLQLTAEIFPDLSERLEAAYGHLIPMAQS